MRAILFTNLAFCAALSGFSCSQGLAATLAVLDAADNNGPNTFTLRDVINNHAQAGDTITFTSNFPPTITLTLGELVIDKDLTILGPGATKLSIVAANHRLFHLTQIGFAKISGLRLHGSVSGVAGVNGPSGTDGGSAGGGCILTELSSSLIMTNCYFEGCSAKAGAGGNAVNNNVVTGNGGNGGAAQGGAIESHGELKLFGCTFYKNYVSGGNGGNGLYGGNGGNGGNGEGGAVYQGYTFGCPPVEIFNCTLSGNSARGGKGGKGGDAPSALIVGVPLHGGPGGKGGDTSGGGLYFFYGCAGPSPCDGIIHCTISKNVCIPGVGGPGGAGVNGGAPGATGATGAAKGCGLYDTAFPGQLPIGNTIIAGNYPLPINLVPQGPDVFGPVGSLGHNLIGALDANSTGWQAGVDYSGTTATPLKPGLGPLQDNGGETPTMLPLAGSPAIDTGTVNCAPLDQIGKPRPVIITGMPPAGSDGSDIGACELQSKAMKAAAILNITPSEDGMMITWPASLTDFVLQESSALDGRDWVESRQTLNAVGDDNVVVVQSPAGNKFFRLVLFRPSE